AAADRQELRQFYASAYQQQSEAPPLKATLADARVHVERDGASATRTSVPPRDRRGRRRVPRACSTPRLASCRRRAKPTYHARRCDRRDSRVLRRPYTWPL